MLDQMGNSSVLVVLVALFFGAFVGAWWGRTRLQPRLNDVEAQLAEREESLEKIRVDYHETERLLAEREALLNREQQHSGQLQTRYHQLESESAALRTHCAELEISQKKDQAHYEERLQLLDRARLQLKDEFQHLAAKIFEERSVRFSQQSQKDMNHLLTPLRQQLQEFRTRLEGMNEQDIKRQASLSAQLDQLGALNRQMSEDASNLTRALKGDSKKQGQWGELMLESVLEHSGLRKGIEYEREVAFRTDEGRKRPDAIVRLPDDRHLIIDAKVSLLAYSQYIAAETEEERTLALRQHLRSIRSHMEGLAARDYAQLPGINSPDMVFMFMPIEPAFALAFENDEQLFNDAFNRHVVIVTPTTLLASLRTVANLWRLEQHNENARLVIERGEKLLDKCLGFIESLEEIGTHLSRAEASHQRAMKRLSTGQGSVVSQARSLKELGLRSKKELPKLIDEEEDNDDDTQDSE